MATGGGSKMVAERISRITDISGEPLTYLIPIGGYEKMPLVSLEEAVEELVPILPKIRSHVFVAKQRCEDPADGLSPDESASIMLYTMTWEPLDGCLYFVLNSILRLADREQKLKPWYLYLRLFLNAILRLSPVRKTIHRGVRLNMSKKYIRGKTLVWWAFSSCTMNVEVLQSKEFLGETGARTLFYIQCETARDIQRHSYYRDEDEMLLLAATQFKVTGCLNQGDLCIVHLEETPPPYPLLEPVPIVYPTNKSSPSEANSTQTKLPKPEYRNAELEQIIAQNGNKNKLALCHKCLTGEDMLIVAYYALQENKVSDLVCHAMMTKNETELCVDDFEMKECEVEYLLCIN